MQKSVEYSTKCPMPNFYKGDYCAINDFLRTVDWVSYLNEDDINLNYRKLIDLLQSCIECYIPKKNQAKENDMFQST